MDAVLNAALPFAEQMLDEHGEFFPYGVSIDIDGKSGMIGGDPGHGEHPASTAVLGLLVEGLRQKRDSLRAVGLVSDVRLSEPDAVRVEIEHRDGQVIAVMLTYTKKRFGRGAKYRQLVAVPAERRIWSA